jgi:hypothetical protein
MDLMYKTVYIHAERRFVRYMTLGANLVFQMEFEDKDSVVYSGNGFGLFIRRYNDDNFFIHGGLTGGTMSEDDYKYYYLIPAVSLGFKFSFSHFYIEPEISLSPVINLNKTSLDRWTNFLLFIGIAF